MCLWAIYIFPGPVHIFPPAEKADPSWKYIIRSQKNECGNWDWGPDIPYLGIFVSICFIFPPAEKANPSWKYIIRSQKNESGNWDWGPDIPYLGIFVPIFRPFVFAVFPPTSCLRLSCLFLKVTSGQIPAWECYHWIGLRKNANRYTVSICCILIVNFLKDLTQ